MASIHLNQRAEQQSNTTRGYSSAVFLPNLYDDPGKEGIFFCREVVETPWPCWRETGNQQPKETKNAFKCWWNRKLIKVRYLPVSLLLVISLICQCISQLHMPYLSMYTAIIHGNWVHGGASNLLSLEIYTKETLTENQFHSRNKREKSKTSRKLLQPGRSSYCSLSFGGGVAEDCWLPIKLGRKLGRKVRHCRKCIQEHLGSFQRTEIGKLEWQTASWL